MGTQSLQVSSQPPLQQAGSARHTASTQGLQPTVSAGPTWQTECTQLHCVPHCTIAMFTQPIVQLSVQHVGSWLHTASTHGSPPQSTCAWAEQAASHIGGEPWQHEGICAQTSSMQGSWQSVVLSGPRAKQAE